MAHVIETTDALKDSGTSAASANPEARQTSTVVAFPAAGPPRSRRKMVWMAGTALATAAAVLLVVRTQPTWVRSLLGDTADSRLADLAGAVGDERTVEGRLTGGFRHGSLRAPVRSGGSSAPADWTLYAAAGRIRELADDNPTAENLHALGVAHLVVGEHDAAVQALEDATTETPGVARYEADLAAAYLARAARLDRPDDLPRALGAAERSLAADPNLPEARFNRALALEALHLTDQARAAWEAYLQVDAGSGWADEARRRLAGLQTTLLTPPADGVRINSPPLTDLNVEAGLEWLVRHGLPAWARAVLATDSDLVSREHQFLTEYAAQISARALDPFAERIVRLPSLEAGDARLRADGILQLATALEHLDLDAMPRAEAPLSAGCPKLTGALADFCETQLGAIDVLMRRSDRAAGRAAAIVARAQADGSAYLLGRGRMLDGFRLVFASDYRGATALYQQAVADFHRGRYRASSANAAAQLAELLELSGAPVDAWRLRIRALEGAAASGVARLSYLTKVSTAWSLARRDAFHASRTFLEAADDDLSNFPPLQKLASVLSAVTAALAVGEIAAASSLVDDALRTIDESSDGRAARMRADVIARRAAVRLKASDFAGAEADLTTAIDMMGPERGMQRADALLTRAVIRASNADFATEASEDLDAALAILDTLGTVSGASVAATSGSLGASRAAAAVIRVNPALHNLRGLHLAERIKEAFDAVPSDRRLTAAGLDAAIQARAPHDVTVFFLPSEDELLVWVVKSGSAAFVSKQVALRTVERLVALLSIQVERTPQNDGLWRDTLRQLHELLLADLPGVADAGTLTIVPDGPLTRVPFSGLIDASGRFLFDRVPVVVAPNLAYAFAAPPAAAGAPVALVVGEPDLIDASRNGLPSLPRARTEALKVGTQYDNASVMLGIHATRDAVLQQLPLADVFHFSGHALVPPGGAQPRLLLAGSIADPANGLDASAATLRLKPGARVVLAGCETGAAPHDRTTGISSVSRGFLRAGARSVVGTLWKLDDSSAEEFFVMVHARMRAGESPAVAVSAAQRACRQSETCRAAAGTWLGTVVYGASD